MIAGVVLLMRWLGKSGAKLLEAQRARLAAAKEGRATVKSAESSGMVQGVAKTPMVRLELEVTPPGGAPYLARTAWFVDLVAMPRVQPGLELAVKIDAEDPALIYPAEPWARYDGALAKLALGLKKS